jgi:hypothetical protein
LPIPEPKSQIRDTPMPLRSTTCLSFLILYSAKYSGPSPVDSHVLTMLVVVFVGEAVEFGLVHVAIGLPVSRAESFEFLRSRVGGSSSGARTITIGPNI